LGWWVANLSCEFFSCLYPAQYLHIRYEDLARNPRTVLGKLLTSMAPFRAWEFAGIGANDNRHQVHGNRMRFQRLSFADVREDAAWKNEMPRWYKHLVSALTWPLRRRYGY
jgi:hypothetical protein